MTVGVLQAMSVIVALALTLSMSPFVEAMAGGEAAKPGEFPHAVQLSSSKTGKVFCGGSILSPNVVITAAHCVYPYWRKRKSGQNSLCFRSLSVEPSLEQDLALVTPGTLETRDWKGFKECGVGMGKTRTVDRYVIHPYFNISSLENDIALLIFGDPLNFTDNVKAIQLPPRNMVYSRGTLLGWGYAVRRSSPYLKKMEFVFKNRESCNRDPLMMIEPKERKVTDWELCTKWTKGNSSCKRDSGSSIICQDSNATLHNNGTTNSSLSPIICGIASFIKAVGHCGESDNIGVFVDVSKYLYWIQEEAEKNVDEVKKIKMMQRIILFTSLVYLGIVIVVLVVGLLVFCLYTTIKKIYLSRVTPESPV